IRRRRVRRRTVLTAPARPRSPHRLALCLAPFDRASLKLTAQLAVLQRAVHRVRVLLRPLPRQFVLRLALRLAEAVPVPASLFAASCNRALTEPQRSLDSAAEWLRRDSAGALKLPRHTPPARRLQHQTSSGFAEVSLGSRALMLDRSPL